LRKHGRTDGNQQEIIDSLRRLGATVKDTSALGHGFPDIVVGHRRFNWLIEIKLPGQRLTEPETLFHSAWSGQIAVVHSIEEALELIGREENARGWRRSTAGRGGG
jgi:hypothetical protein